MFRTGTDVSDTSKVYGGRGFGYNYDPIGNRTSASETIGGETLVKTYAANELNQYTSIANPVAVGLRGVATNTATVTVNAAAATRDSVASTTRPWPFALPADNANGGKYTLASIMAVVNPAGTNTQDSVDSATGFVYAPPQQETPTYDDDGNLLSDGRWHYTWNGENRLIKAEEQVCPTNRTLRKVDYAYDHQGRMVWKKISHGGAEAQSWQDEKTLSYLWDNFNIIAETSVADSATNITYNVWGLDVDGTMQGAGGVGGLLSVMSPLLLGGGQGEGSTVYLPCYDANGNIMEYVSDDGTIAAHCEYDPFGGTVVATGDANAFTHWFSTKPWCSITGLSEYQYRKYNPVLGRWLSRDPSTESGGVNLYFSLDNDLISNIDLLGLIDWSMLVNAWISETLPLPWFDFTVTLKGGEWKECCFDVSLSGTASRGWDLGRQLKVFKDLPFLFEVGFEAGGQVTVCKTIDGFVFRNGRGFVKLFGQFSIGSTSRTYAGNYSGFRESEAHNWLSVPDNRRKTRVWGSGTLYGQIEFDLPGLNIRTEASGVFVSGTVGIETRWFKWGWDIPSKKIWP